MYTDPCNVRPPRPLNHWKTRHTKNEKMAIVLAKDVARSTTDLSDELLERWLELRRCFSA